MMRVLRTAEGDIVLDVTGKNERRLSVQIHGMPEKGKEEQGIGAFF